MPYLSIVIPAYNESARIVKTLENILSYLKDKKFETELIVVDDGSSDATKAIVEKFSERGIRLISNGTNHGKGYAVKRGMLAAKGDWILFTDADLSTPIEELDRFLELHDYDILIASRALRDSRIITHQPFYREFGGKLINFFVQLIALPGIKDTQCGFKLFRKNCAQKIFARQTLNGWGFDAEILFIAKRLGCRILELPVLWKNDPDTKVKPFQTGFRMLMDLVRIRVNAIKGRYD